MKVCIIDDNKSITGMISKALKMEGHIPVIINDPHDGLKALQENSYDSVILDIAMPELSGIDILQSLTESGKIKNHNICVLTASTATHDSEAAKKFAIKEFLVKPIDLSKLVKILESMIQ